MGKFSTFWDSRDDLAFPTITNKLSWTKISKWRLAVHKCHGKLNKIFCEGVNEGLIHKKWEEVEEKWSNCYIWWIGSSKHCHQPIDEPWCTPYQNENFIESNKINYDLNLDTSSYLIVSIKLSYLHFRCWSWYEWLISISY